MSKPRPFLNTPYGAYFAREVPPPDDELVRVGPGTPCGEYLRRFWQPIILSEALHDLPRRLLPTHDEHRGIDDARQDQRVRRRQYRRSAASSRGASVVSSERSSVILG